MDDTAEMRELDELVIEEIKELLVLRARAQRLSLAYLEDFERGRAMLDDPTWQMQLQQAKDAFALEAAKQKYPRQQSNIWQKCSHLLLSSRRTSSTGESALSRSATVQAGPSPFVHRSLRTALVPVNRSAKMRSASVLRRAATRDLYAKTFQDAFNVKLRRLRCIGRESEYPIVTSEGAVGSAQDVMNKLTEGGGFVKKQELDAFNKPMLVGLEGPNYSISAEVGVGTIEVVSQPVESLFALQQNHVAALDELGKAVDETGQHLLGFGVQPLTPMSADVLLLKHRYKLMHKVLGDPWLSFTITASEQTHVDIVAKEVLQTINITNLLSAVYTALFANSSIVAGELADAISAREQFMGRIEPQWHRHGMPLRAVHSIEDWVDYLSEMTFYMAVDTTTGKSRVPSLGPVPFKEYMSQQPPNWGEFVNHDHYVWHSCRARFKQSTVEFRAACQQPFQDQMVVPALSLGVVQSMQDIERWLLSTRPIEEWWSVLSQAHQHTIQHGLQGADCINIQSRDSHQITEQFDLETFTHHILQFAEEGLRRRGLHEEVFLQPLFRRLKYRANPGQQAADIFRQGGMSALLRATAQSYAPTTAAVAAV